jgi:hypothetical protein
LTAATIRGLKPQCNATGPASTVVTAISIDAVCAAERFGGLERDDRSKRAGGQEPIDDRNVDLPLHLAGGVKHAHAGQKAELDRLLGQRIGTRDDGLGGDDRRQGREPHHPVVRPSWCE